jgi:chromosome segregation ATPase
LKSGQDELKADYREMKSGQDELKADYRELKSGQDELKADYRELKSGQDELKSGYAKLDDRLTSLEGKVDERLRETRPVWEGVLSRLDSLETLVANGFHRLERRIGVIAADINQLRADLHYLEDRIEKVEQHS